jgi:hypothetical protein
MYAGVGNPARTFTTSAISILRSQCHPWLLYFHVLHTALYEGFQH